jgi:hypothetical protein
MILVAAGLWLTKRSGLTSQGVASKSHWKDENDDGFAHGLSYLFLMMINYI